MNDFTYTLETIIQAGNARIPMMTVPIRTNEKTRESRLFKGIGNYLQWAFPVITRSFLLYQPFKFFVNLGLFIFSLGVILGIRFLFFYFGGSGGGHVQSLILASIFLLVGFQTITIGLLADIISANRKLLEDIQYRIRKEEITRKTHES